ncbi:MAG: diguanylate cyclase [Deltaproteobacteria bacterium]|nr:diguanylate cyclase [Deltaproteobacteria bacterium]
MNFFGKSHSLFINLLFGVGAILFLCMGSLAYFSINYFNQTIMNNAMAEADRFNNTIKLGTHYSMMTNVRDDITQIIRNIAKQENVEHIRIYHKDGHVIFSNKDEEIGTITHINNYACAICHKFAIPPTSLTIKERARIFSSPAGRRFLGIVTPIYNEQGCSSASCHAHSPDTTILGTLDTVIALDEVDREIHFLEQVFSAVIILIFLITSSLIVLYLLRFVSQPVKKMITGTQMIAKGEFFNAGTVERNDEMGRLASAISHMGEEIARQQDELVQANDELVKANQELQKLSNTDALTRLYNRRFLLETLDKEYRRAMRYVHELSVLLIDADHFKQVNDQHGHLCGDMVLKSIADTLGKSVRNTDIVARYGGEEMVVLLPETDRKRAVHIAEKLRKEIESSEIPCDGKHISITVSIGVATYPENNVSDPMLLVEAADLAMYEAKKTGRNKVCYRRDNSTTIVDNPEI